MAKMKVHELAKELDIPSKDLVSYLREKGVDIKTHFSVIEDKEIRIAEDFFGRPKKSESAEKKAAPEGKQRKQLFDANGNPIKRKLDANGRPLPITEPVFDADGKPVQLRRQLFDANGNPIKRKLDKDGKPLPITGPVFDADGKPVQLKRRAASDGAGKAAETEAPAEKKETAAPAAEKKETPESVVREEAKKTEPEEKTAEKKEPTKEAPNGGERRTREAQSYGNGERRQSGQNGFNGNRGTGSFGGNRPAGQNANGFRRPAGAAGGFNKGGFDKDKDDDKRSFQRKNDHRGGQSGSIKTELGKELTKEQRAAAFSDRSRDKNRNSRNFDGDESSRRAKKKDPNRKGAFIMPKPVPVKKEDPNEIRTITIGETITLKELADKMKQNAAAIVKKLFLAGKIVNINSDLTFEEAEEIALEYNCIVEKEEIEDVVETLMMDIEDPEETLVKRPPIVCVMGHVDHGKTSILDAIRSTNVTSREAGGITQHIGAYMVEINGEKITFLDTPGHEAFTAMRMRGAKSTDIAVLVVAADDGVMPQTIEAINHAKAAEVQIVVAMNKMDKEGANPDRVLTELSEQGLVAESWGGDTVVVPVSAKTGEGIEQLLEMILLTAEVGELKANPNRRARGIVIESKLDKGRGPVATVLIQKGTLKVGDNVAIGSCYGKVRAMINDKGVRVSAATPSTPVELLGLDGVPGAGDTMVATETEKEARNIAEAFISQSRERLIADTKAKLSLEGLFDQIQSGNMKELNVIVKADVMGSVEAVKQSLLKLSNEEVAVRCIHGGVGNINESDVILASASNAIIIGFNVKPDNTAKDTAERENVDIRLYSVIYNAIEDIEAAMKGMLDPVYEEKVIGHAEVRQLFKASGLGVIAGSYVLDGKVVRNCKARITRGGEQLFDGNLASLKRFKDDAKEVAAGYECGLVFEKFGDLQEMDSIEFYIMQEVPRK
ncbi:MAG: translation initiation factor IF-2 [Lachnospiraceae bacterium]|nr:translation initiation factor IF-2 [Lachnospiraceae bacterium]